MKNGDLIAASLLGIATIPAQGPATELADHCKPPGTVSWQLRGWLRKHADLAVELWQGRTMPNQLYMVVEHFKDKDPVPVYMRFRDNGRMAPQGLDYVSSWVDEKLERCFQLMEAPNRELLDLWIAKWADIVNFEIWPVITSKEAAERVAARL